MALAWMSAAGARPFTLHTPSTKPSRSTTATTLAGETTAARDTACANTVVTSANVICARTGVANSRAPRMRTNSFTPGKLWKIPRTAASK